MENNHDIDQKFSEASKSSDEPETFPRFEKVWDRIEDRLERKEEKKRIFFLKIPYGIAASLIIGSGIFYFLDKKESLPEPIHPVIAESPVSPKVQTDNIKTESTVTPDLEKAPEAPATLPPQPVIAYSGKIPVVEKNIELAYVPVSPSADGYLAAKVDPENSGTVIPENKHTRTEKGMEEVVIASLGTKRAKQSASYSTQAISSAQPQGKPNNSLANILRETPEAEQIAPDDIPDLIISAYGKEKYKTRRSIINTTSLIAKREGNSRDVELKSIIQEQLKELNIGVGNKENKQQEKTNYGAVIITGTSVKEEQSEPLYIINGEISDAVRFKNLEPTRIKSITIFKNPKVISIYGSKAENGVVVIETKNISNTQKEKLEELLEEASSEDESN
ncbi:hypothetical protein HNP38_000141 [Chryseobacterium defluvii]|uniref:TonB-dependent SusC/RagA subfamily outer membrane receptor n=1 Tax=Chryseobacterium defluvii TaxID=160396 RepID=A0A840K6M9_9FLAO|nr:hypothetical protein [Chryseobacterium defluvii]MBB4804869.1 hypothetical protein [Chryseobacterium defluvii]